MGKLFALEPALNKARDMALCKRLCRVSYGQMIENADATRAARDPQPADNLILWLPVFLACGIGLYFSLPFEPSIFVAWAGLGLATIAAIVTFRWRHALAWRWVVAFAGAFFLGLLLAQSQVRGIKLKLLDQRVWSAEVTGVIQEFERVGQGWKIVVKNARIENVPEEYTLRLSMRQKGFVPDIGGRLRVKASLMPPSAPLVPGSYDFRRHAFFHDLSGYGYTTKILAYQAADRPDQNYLETYRDWLTDQVYANLKQPEAGIVTAMLNGQRAGISRETTRIMQQSGLQHVISISGLHVGLLAMTVFYISRLLMAASMTLALRWPIKKIAAVLALVAINFYLLVVGISPPTLRAVIMSSMALAAVMLDREPIQMRVVALSALFILCLQPVSLIDIGFQMSFAAVIGLVAFFQQTRNFWSGAFWRASIILKALRALLVTAVTSVIATMVTAPLVLLYFQQIPLLSILSNLMAMVPITFLIMPGTFLSYLLTPAPVLGPLAVKVMGTGVTWMLDIARFVAGLPSSVWRAPPLPLGSVIIILAGFFIVIAVKRKERWLGIVVALLGFTVLPFYPQPDFLLMESRVMLQPHLESGVLYAEGKLGGFEKNLMLQWTGTQKAQPFACGGDICDLEVKGKSIRLIRTVPALRQACKAKADMILTRYYLDWKCGKTIIIDRHVLERGGGQAIWLKDEISVESVYAKGRRRRPWH